MDYVLSILAGGLVVLSMTLNSSLGLRVGVLRATAVNYLVGLVGVGALAMLSSLVLHLPEATQGSVPWWAWSGGLLGVAIVASSNLVLPRIPVVAATVLIVLGQLATGVVFDSLQSGALDPWQTAGALLVLLGALLSQKRRMASGTPDAPETPTG